MHGHSGTGTGVGGKGREEFITMKDLKSEKKNSNHGVGGDTEKIHSPRISLISGLLTEPLEVVRATSASPGLHAVKGRRRKKGWMHDNLVRRPRNYPRNY